MNENMEKRHIKILKEKHDIIKKQSQDTGETMENIIDDILEAALVDNIDNEIEDIF